MQLCCTHQSYLFVQPSLRLLIRFLPDLDLVCFFPLCHWLIHLSKGSKFHGECPGCGSSSRPVLGIFIYLPVFIWLVVWKCLEHVLWLSIQLGISSSQLTFTPSFFRWVGIPPTGYLFGFFAHVSAFLEVPLMVHLKKSSAKWKSGTNPWIRWFGTCFTFPYAGKKDPKWYFSEGMKPATIISIYIYTCVMSVTSLCAMYQTQHVFIKTQHDLRICPYWKVVEFQPDELGDSTGATSAWLKEAADALGGGSGCVR